ncbi:MAG TPA: hypothetical protein VIX14_13655 [Terriglobales bacterium]
MNRKTYASILGLTLLVIIFLTGCSSYSAPPIIAITGASPAASTTVTTDYGNLTAVVTSNGTPVGQGVAVTFTAPTAGPTGTFAGGASSETDMTDSTGTATSSLFTANYVPGAFAVAIATLPAGGGNISLTNGGGVYSFYVTGTELINSGPNFYALAGSVVLDAAGDVVPYGDSVSNPTGISGEQDYNDALGITSPQPSGDAILAEPTALMVANGQGTLTLTTNNTALGVAGVETLGVQFVNNSHALITQFDGSATSSGSLDLQILPSTPGGNFAFTLSGVDPGSNSVVYGGVFALAATMPAPTPPTLTLKGIYDENDAGTPSKGQTLVGTASQSDALGRGTITGTNLGGYLGTLNYYIVGPEAIRIIDVDANDSAVGSVFGQGSATFTNASFGAACAPAQCSVFGVESNSSGLLYAAAGQIAATPAASPDTTDGTFTGVGDVDETGIVCVDSVTMAPPCTIVGTYFVSGTTNGYGNLTITAGDLGDVSVLGIYMTDPALNLNDPNNTAGGGGALVAELDINLVGTGVLTPQTDTKPGDFTGSASSYTFGAQDYFCSVCEFDYVGQGSFTAGAFAGTGLVSDPFDFFLSGVAPNTGVGFSGTPLADATESATGRYTLFTTNTPPNPLVITVTPPTPPTMDNFNVAIYQASGTQAYWIGEDSFSLSLGPMEQQGDMSLVPAVKTARAAAKAKQKQK